LSATQINSTDPLYVGENRYTEADFSKFSEFYRQTGATVSCSIIAGAGFTPAGGATWDQSLKRAQVRGTVTAGGATLLLSGG
jgi:hypothetical protein